MSLSRVLRYGGGLVLATILLAVLLPLAGVVKSKFLPPSVAYGTAAGRAFGQITKKEVQPSANPFKVGEHIYLVDYQFYAPDPPGRGAVKPGPKQLRTGQVRVDQSVWGDSDHPEKSGVQPGDRVVVKYEKTYPEISGIVQPVDLGRGCGPGANILSGWLVFLAADLALGYVLMLLVMERFGAKENL